MEKHNEYVNIQLRGRCDGRFGDGDSDWYVEASGKEWVVVRNERGQVQFTAFDTEEELRGFLKVWKMEMTGWTKEELKRELLAKIHSSSPSSLLSIKPVKLTRPFPCTERALNSLRGKTWGEW